jgi:DNA-binding LytR/AlgR family response regulator
MIKTIAIDDEPLALKMLISYIKKTPFLELAGQFDNPISALEFLENNSIDLIFLDIHMPDLLGTEFAKVINKNTKIIFTTAYEKYAIEGYKLEAIDYLLKPYGYDDFLISAQKAKKQIELEQKNNQSLSKNDFIFLKSDYKTKRINFDEIIYIEGLKDYIKVYIQNETNPLLSISSLKLMEEKLPKDKFMRVHKSFIVNLTKVKTIERSRIVFGKDYIPIGDQYKDNFQKFLEQNLL